jgi:putative ABC transport system ATP-binding protein
MSQTGIEVVEREARTRAAAPVIALSHIIKSYPMGESRVVAVRDVSLVVSRGEFVGIVGASGSGKSTLMSITGCLDFPTSGHFSLEGVNIRELSDRELSRIRNTRIGFVFQGFNLIPRMTALQNVELPLVYAGMKSRVRRQRAEAALQIVGLADHAHHMPNKLSGGQQQRVAVARAISTNPALILADEPTGALDSRSSAELMSLFAQLHLHGRTIVMITHERDMAQYASRVVELRDGAVISDHSQVPVGASRSMRQRGADS